MKSLSFFFAIAMLACALIVTVPGLAQTNYYSRSTGYLNVLSTWGTNTNGTGTSPTRFTTANQIFNVRNNATPTLSAAWTVSGTGSKIIVGDGTAACNFQIPSNYTCAGKIDVASNATLSIARTTNPTLGTLNANSTVVFNGTANQTIPAVTYGNLTYAGAALGKMASGGCTIAGTLTVTSGTLQLDVYTTPYTYSVKSLNVTTSGLLDLGAADSYTGMGATINLSGDLFQSGAGQIYCTGDQELNGIINFVGTNQNIQQASSDYVNYNVQSGSTCNLTGDFSFDGYNSWQGIFTVNSGGTLNCGTYSVIGYSLNTSANNNIFVLSSGGTLVTANTAGIASSGTSGSIQTLNRTFSSSANYTYNGTAAQNAGIFTTSPTAYTLNNLTINNPEGVTLSHAESVSNTLTLTDGLLNTTTTNLITLNNTATVTGASDASFVNGPIKKIGKQAFIFPVGAAGTGYIPIGISAPTSVTAAFQAQYIRSSAAALGTVTAFGLNHVSGCDYWILNQTSGTSTVNVTGYWNANSPCGGAYVNSLPSVALAHFNNTNWNSWGNTGGVTGNTTAGSVTWNGVSTFSPFALASTDILNPLPLLLTGFKARALSNGSIGLTWSTMDESNVSYFTIQRSPDGTTWQDAGSVNARGSTSMENSYSFTDPAPFAVKDYYRLQIVDNDGNLTYSGILVIDPARTYTLLIYPNPATDQVTIRFNGISGMITLQLLNIEGKVLLQKKPGSVGGASVSLPVSMYPPGNYLVQVLADGRLIRTEKLVIQRK
ncbi:MAG TPA: T9SS type A sorting domain-containing protein [Puia sp.]|jgi:hypothetical protein